MKLLGNTVQDLVTGFVGVATGYITYLSGCNQYLCVPKVGADGKIGESVWFDEQRLVRVPGTEDVVLNNVVAGGEHRLPPPQH